MPSKYRKVLVIGHDPKTGEQIRKNFYGKTKREVKQKVDRYKLCMANGTLYDDAVCFNEWSEKWLELYKEGNVSEKTFIGYKSCVGHLNDYFKNCPMKLITPEMIGKFFKAKQDMSESSVNKLKITINAIFETAIQNRIVTFNPAKNIPIAKGKKPKGKRVFTEDEFDTVKEFAKQAEHGLGVFIILSTGVRRGELMGLKASDFDFKNNRLTIARTITETQGYVKIKTTLKNGDESRTIPIRPEDAEHIKSAIAGTKGFIFKVGEDAKTRKPTDPMAPMTWSKKRLKRFYNELDAYLESMKMDPIEHLNAHELRHTYGTILFKQGNDGYVVQKILGHHSLDITMGIYVHDNVEDIEQRIVWKR